MKISTAAPHVDDFGVVLPLDTIDRGSSMARLRDLARTTGNKLELLSTDIPLDETALEQEVVAQVADPKNRERTAEVKLIIRDGPHDGGNNGNLGANTEFITGDPVHEMIKSMRRKALWGREEDLRVAPDDKRFIGIISKPPSLEKIVEELREAEVKGDVVLVEMYLEVLAHAYQVVTPSTKLPWTEGLVAKMKAGKAGLCANGGELKELLGDNEIRTLPFTESGGQTAVINWCEKVLGEPLKMDTNIPRLLVSFEHNTDGEVVLQIIDKPEGREILYSQSCFRLCDDLARNIMRGFYQEEHDGTGRGDGGNTQLFLNGDDIEWRIVMAHAIKGCINHHSSSNLRTMGKHVPGLRQRLLAVVEETQLPSGVVPVRFVTSVS